jgi:large subunit ribosomal protein L23
MKMAQDIVIRPIVSEKSYDRMGEGVYQFKVAKSANKHEIKDAIESLFKVTVNKVNTVMVVRKPKRRGMYQGFTPQWKKAIVTLKEGDSIAFFEGIA